MISSFSFLFPISKNINPQSLFIRVLLTKLTKLLLQVTLKEQDTEVDLFFFFNMAIAINLSLNTLSSLCYTVKYTTVESHLSSVSTSSVHISASCLI